MSTISIRRRTSWRCKHKDRGEWLELEAALFKWQQRIQKKKAVITGEILKQQAAKLWNTLPQYQGKEQPKFSNGWLSNFQKRFNIRECVNHGEAASAQIDKPDAIVQMEKVRLLATEYDIDDVLNIDETGLF
jgi:hypothetical protein